MKAWETDETFLSRWLSGELTEEELRSFKASPEYESYVATAEALKPFEVGEYDETAELGKVMKRIQSEKQEEGKVVSLGRIWYFAAAAVIILLIGFFWLRQGEQIVAKEILAEKREQVVLPDQSSIELQAGSFLSYAASDWENNREVFLKGEAFFEVEKGEKFDIKLKDGTVSILGTSFLITEMEDSLEVVCFSGKVQVEAYGFKEILEAGEKVLAVKDKSPERTETALVQPLWLSSNIRLTDAPLSVVLMQLEEIYGVQFTGSIDQQNVFTGNFPTGDLETALAQVLGPFNIEYELDEARTLVIFK
ncbi:MAG: FecR family protein [Bacteroidia bacterium]|nr:FecR family protein [Bacteroidia bacterium]